MRGFDHATILSPSFQGLLLERLAQCPPISVQNTTKNALLIMSLAAYASETNKFMILDALVKTFTSEIKLSNCPTFRACLHGRWGPQEGEVTSLGVVTRLAGVGFGIHQIRAKFILAVALHHY